MSINFYLRFGTGSLDSLSFQSVRKTLDSEYSLEMLYELLNGR